MATCSSYSTKTTTSTSNSSTATNTIVSSSAVLKTASATYSSPFIKIHAASSSSGSATSNSARLVDPSQVAIGGCNNSSSHSSRFERNYSYIEAMKDIQNMNSNALHIHTSNTTPLAPPPPSLSSTSSTQPLVVHHTSSYHQKSAINNKITQLLSSKVTSSSASSSASSSSRTSSSVSSSGGTNGSTRRAMLVHQETTGNGAGNEIEIRIKLGSGTTNGIKMNGASASTSSSCSPTAAASSVATLRNGDMECVRAVATVMPCGNGAGGPLDTSNLAKSRSQSSILSIFKSTFSSPFQIRKWKSKSKDKIDKMEDSVDSHAHRSNPKSNGVCLPIRKPNGGSVGFVGTSKTATLQSNASSTSSSSSSHTLPNYGRNGHHNTVGGEIITVVAKPKVNQTGSSSAYHSKESKRPPAPPPPLPVSPPSNNNNNNTSNAPAAPFFLPNTSLNFDSPTNKPPHSTTSLQSATNNNNSSSLTSSFAAYSPVPITPRQLSYLKLTCLVNGYDSAAKRDAESPMNPTVEPLPSPHITPIRPTSPTIVNNNTVPPAVDETSRPREPVNEEQPVIETKSSSEDDIIATKPAENNISSSSPPVSADLPKVDENDLIVYDGEHYTKLLNEATEHINQLCKQYEIHLDQPATSPNHVPNEEALGQIQTTIGKAQLLINQKMKQFRELCEKNIKEKTVEPTDGTFLTRDEDLAGFWDMVCLQIDDIKKMFAHLDVLKAQKWNPRAASAAIASANAATSSATNRPKTTLSKPRPKTTLNAAAHRDAAKKRLEEAKNKVATLKQNHNTAATNSHPDIQHFQKKK